MQVGLLIVAPTHVAPGTSIPVTGSIINTDCVPVEFGVYVTVVTLPVVDPLTGAGATGVPTMRSGAVAAALVPTAFVAVIPTEYDLVLANPSAAVKLHVRSVVNVMGDGGVTVFVAKTAPVDEYNVHA